MNKKILIVLLIFLTFAVVISCYFSSADAENHAYIEVTIHPGDTLWSIAQKYNKGEKDIRFLIHQIEVKNNLSSAVLIPWQILKVPI